MREAFPDGHWKVIQYIELPEEGRIATRDLWTGTHLGPFMGVPATGKKISIAAFALVLFSFVSGLHFYKDDC